METELYVDMQNEILHEADLLYSLSDLAAQLDCLIALSLAAENYQLCRPIISEGGRTVITRGRHLLQESCVDLFIPNGEMTPATLWNYANVAMCCIEKKLKLFLIQTRTSELKQGLSKLSPAPT